ncbi:hypothetical protein HDV05_006501 [Chytridiales sp. JEL 0842]|nr:hypothetical protein HDV05_006501 [Chytridiales sp. JEL 0842]
MPKTPPIKISYTTAVSQAAPLVTPDSNLNALDIYCISESCNCLILKANTATKCETAEYEINLPALLSAPSSTSQTQTTPFYWKLTNMMHFENIAFSKPIPGTQTKVLACADCDLGPVGFQPEGKGNVFLVCAERVAYARV